MFDLWRIVVLLTAGGIVGGMLYWTSTYISSVNLPVGSPSNKWKPTALFCLANAFMGMGGAWAALLAMFWARRVPIARTPMDFLELLATSIVAGYAGNRILPAVASGMTQQLLESATATALAAAKSANRSQVFAQALAYLVPGAPQSNEQTSRILTALRTELQTDPGSIEIPVLLARTLAERANDTKGALHTLTSLASSIGVAAARPHDHPIAGALWNLALYSELQFERNHQSQMRQDAISALTELLKIAPSYRSRIISDPLLADLRTDPSAKEIL